MIYFLLFLLNSAALHATSFGPIQLVGQVENSPFVVRGRAEDRTVDRDRETQQPHTYWKFRVVEQMRGDPIGSNVTIRQPGGEIGEFGYHVAGTANFRIGEEVVVMLRGTGESGVYDVVGLSAGKYTVKDGGKELENALGFAASNAKGRPFTLDEFRSFVDRVNSQKATNEDRSIILNNGAPGRHEDEGEIDPREPDQKEVKDANAKLDPSAIKSQQNPANPFQAASEFSEESSKGHSIGWWISLAGVGSALVALWFFFRRK